MQISGARQCAPLQLEIDLLHSQKTGLYLDQLSNYPIVAQHAAGRRVLDCFANEGAFALSCGDMAGFVKRLKADGETKILTVGNDALNQGARIAMFFQDFNGFIFESIQRLENPAAKRE